MQCRPESVKRGSSVSVHHAGAVHAPLTAPGRVWLAQNRALEARA